MISITLVSKLSLYLLKLFVTYLTLNLNTLSPTLAFISFLPETVN